MNKRKREALKAMRNNQVRAIQGYAKQRTGLSVSRRMARNILKLRKMVQTGSPNPKRLRRLVRHITRQEASINLSSKLDTVGFESFSLFNQPPKRD
jgi:hypothetical protein